MKRIRNHFDIRNNSKIAKFRVQCDDDDARREDEMRKIKLHQIKLNRKCYKLQFKWLFPLSIRPTLVDFWKIFFAVLSTEWRDIQDMSSCRLEYVKTRLGIIVHLGNWNEGNASIKIWLVSFAYWIKFVNEVLRCFRYETFTYYSREKWKLLRARLLRMNVTPTSNHI